MSPSTTPPGLRRPATALAAAALLLAGLAACEPCDGVVACATDPSLVISGRMVRWPDGTPVAGVQVRLAGGPADAIFGATSDAEGFFRLTAPATTDETFVVVEIVPPAPHAPYRTEPLLVGSTTTRGEGRDLGRLVVNPYALFVGEVLDRRQDDSPLAAARVSFDPAGDASQRITAQADPAGRFVVLVGTGITEPVRGTLTVSSPDGRRRRTIDDFPIAPRYRDVPLDLDGVIGIGATFRHYVAFFERGGGPGAPPPEGTRIEFVRRGGVALAPDRFEVRTTAEGAISLLATPETEGEVVADLIVHLAPPLAPDTIRALRLATTDDDAPVFFGSFGVGPSLEHAVQYRPRATLLEFPLDSVRAEFLQDPASPGAPALPVRRRDPVADPRIPLTSWGAVTPGLAPLDDGVWRGRVRLHFPRGMPPLEAPLELPTFRTDELRTVDLAVGPSLNHAVEFFVRSAGAQIDAANVQVRFERTGGIRAHPDTFTLTTTSWGAISTATLTTESGVLEGDFIVTLPPPRAGTDTVRGVRIPTFEGDGHGFLGRFGVGGQINYAVGLFDDDTGIGLADVGVRFERTGGIAARPAIVRTRTTDWGAFALQLETDEEGEVVGDLVVELPTGAVRIRNVRVATFRADEFRLLGWFGV